MVRTQVQFTKEQIEALRARASREDVSMAEIVRRAVEAWIATEASWAETRQRALDVAGRFRSGRSDVARRHDDHLSEAFGP
ncbi:MAG: ribbon-helix-helix protein, CopG family [Gemmatimonadota bacterium]